MTLVDYSKLCSLLVNEQWKAADLETKNIVLQIDSNDKK